MTEETTLRTKFRVVEVTKFADYPDVDIELKPVYGTDPDHVNRKIWNDEYYRSRSVINIRVRYAVADFFELNGQYYVDFAKPGSEKNTTGEEVIRAKFKVEEITKTAHFQGNIHIELEPVYNSNPDQENTKFWTSTPSGKIEMRLPKSTIADFFELAEEYYVDFTEVTFTERD